MAKKEFPSDKLDQYIVRFPDGMRDRLKVAAAANKRSLNAEIISRLEASFLDVPKLDILNSDTLPTADQLIEIRKTFSRVFAMMETMSKPPKKRGG
jgi:plasmid stability protein